MKCINFYFVYFIVLSFIGWAYESLLTIFTKQRWENRGFLFGPLCPIYGVGATLGTILFTYVLNDASWYEIFIIGVLASVVLELSVSYILEKFFHAMWWDYSNIPLNYQGRISLPTALCFGVGSLIIVYLFNPIIIGVLNQINDLALYILTLLGVATITADLVTTVYSLSDFETKVLSFNENLDNKMDLLVVNAVELKNELDEAIEQRREILKEETVDQLLKNMRAIHKNALKGIRRFKKENDDLRNKILNKINSRRK